jgi:UDP-GlcNAc:undecaprenyl-phosphate/decaprenyl-phosphate GlcNAc-1-phosphate transferase
MDQVLLPTFISFLLTSLAVYPTIKFAKKFGLVDDPKLRPHPAHIHQRIIPRAGGLACFIGVIITILLTLPIEKHIIGLIIGLIILLIIGLIDDRKKNFSPYLRLIFQFLAAASVVASGVGILFITNPFGGIIRLDSFVYAINFLGTHNIILLADLFALFWIVWIMNMLNWSKGVDGQLPAITLVASIVLGILSLKLYLSGDPQQLNIAKLSFICAGTSLSFLIFNWYPAKIFPGFSGSSILGLLIATIGILSGAKLATAGLVLLIPAIDFLYTFTRRIIQKKSPVWGDRGHLHHKLLDAGLSHWQITCLYLLLSAILGGIALSLDSRGKLFAAILSGLAILGFILWLNFFGRFLNHSDPDNG